MPRAQVTATTDRREKLIDGFLSSNHRMPIWFDSQNCDSNQVRKGSLWLPSSKLLVFPKIKKNIYCICNTYLLLTSPKEFSCSVQKHSLHRTNHQSDTKFKNRKWLRLSCAMLWCSPSMKILSALERGLGSLWIFPAFFHMQVSADTTVKCKEAACLWPLLTLSNFLLSQL